VTTDVLGPKAPADELSLMRLRRVLAEEFGDIPRLEAHLELLDSRGVLYATHAASAWKGDAPAMFFGMVRHVIRTQCDGPAPDPDVEGWLAAGRPTEPDLEYAWDLVNLCRYGTDPSGAPRRHGPIDPAVALLDDVLRRWPGHVGTFATPYGRVEHALESSKLILPPLSV
jgi:hypothetical protein